MMDIRYSCSPVDFKRYNTEETRKEFLIENLFVKNEVVAVYSHVDRMVTLGVMPVGETVPLNKGIDIWKNFGTEYFLERREIGIFNLGGVGQVIADGETYQMGYKDCLYLTRGVKDVWFSSGDSEKPAKFYMVSAPAHCSYESKLIKIEDAAKKPLGALETSNKRVINQFIVRQLPNVLEQGLILLAVATVMFFYDWRLALLLLLPTPIVVFAFRLFWRFMRSMFQRRWDLNSRANAILHDIFSGIRVVKSYGMEKREEERYVEISAKERDAQLRQERFWAILNPALHFLMGFGEYILLYYVGQKMLAGSMTAGEMSQFSSYASMIFGPLNALMIFPRHFMQMMT